MNKKSLLVAGLTSSFGIFVSKALGLLYFSPLTSLAGEENMVFYSICYTYYDLLLKLSGAGIPFAIAALVARYYAKEDYKTVLLVKKLGTSLIMGLSFIVALVFLLSSKALAVQSMGSGASAEDIQNLRNLFLILTIAVLLVPYLSSIRGYYQGLKRLDLYGSSQALEQFARVFSILFFAFLFVKVFKMDGIYAIYVAIAAAAIAALVCILFFRFLTKEDDKRIADLIQTQKDKEAAKSLIFKELLSMGLPYLLISFLGSLSGLINTTFFMDTAVKAGYDATTMKLEMGILQANCNKLAAIPQVLTLGFSAGLVPYLAETKERGDNKELGKQITQILDTVLYILVPALLVFYCFGKDIYFIMYGGANLETGTRLFRVTDLLTFTDTIAPILSSIMNTLLLKKEAVITLLVSLVFKMSSFFVLVRHFGAEGMTYSSLISSAFVIIAYLFILNRKHNVRFKKTGQRFIIILAVSVVSIVPVSVLSSLLNFEYTSRILTILKMGLIGMIILPLYYFISAKLSLPQYIFQIKKLSLKELLKRFRR